jgi:hypothetical protein
MKTQVILLRLAGFISFLFMILHFTFYKMFNWESELQCLSKEDRAIMLTYHAISILITGFMALIPIVQAKTLLNSSLKYTLLSMFSLFYLIRIIAEFTLFGFSKSQSSVILVFCIIPLIFYTIPIFYQPKQG